MVLAAITQYPDAGFAGVPVGLAGQGIRSYLNNAKQTTGVTDLVLVVANSHAYTISINEVPITFTSSGSATAANVRDGIIAAIAADAYASSLVAATASGNNVRLTELTPGVGSVAYGGADGDTTITPVTAHVSAQPMPAGIAVAKGGSGDQDMRLMSASGDQILGVTVHQQQAVQEDTFPSPSRVLYLANSIVPVMDDGEIWVIVEESVTPLSPVFVRYAARGANTQLGSFRASADSSTAVAWTRAAYRSTASAGQIARLSINAP